MWHRTYRICDPPFYRSAQPSFVPLEKLTRNHGSYVWTEALSGMVFVPAQKLSSSITVWTGYAHSSGAFNCFVLAAKVIFQNCVWQGEIHNYTSGTQRNVWAQHFFVKVLRHRFPGTKCGQPTLFFFFILLVYSFSERFFKTFACSKENNRKKILQNCESLVTLWHHIQVTVVKISCSLGILTLSRTIFFPFVHFSSL